MAPGHSAVNEAVALFLAAAETASANGQFAPDVMNYHWCQRISNGWVIWWRPPMPPLMRAPCIAGRICVGLPLHVRFERRRLPSGCGGARTPALGPAVERLPLTDREREIVMLIRNGLTNRDVAQRLPLSVRTVENHIYKAMAETGTISREQLSGLMPAAPNAVPPS